MTTSPSTENSLSLTLNKRPSVMDGLNMIEILPVQRIKALLKSDLLLLHWDWEDSAYANEREQLMAYMKAYKGQGVVVKYIKPKHKWGRVFPMKSLGLSSIRREVRNALIDGLYYDFDLKNAQPEILRNLCESNNIACPMISRYCKNRDSYLQEIQRHYGVQRSQAKELFIRLCFSGSYDGWCLDNKIVNKRALEFIVLFERELKDIADRAKRENPALYETARKKKEDAGETKDKRIIGSFFGLFNQEYEFRIVEIVLGYLINNTNLLKHEGYSYPVGTYEFDGIKLYKENVDKYEGGSVAVLKLLIDKTRELTGFDLQWDMKPLDDGYKLDKWIQEVADEEKPNNELYDDLNKIKKAIDNSDCGIIETIMTILPNHFIYSVDKGDGTKGEWYGWNGSRWEKSDAPLRKAIMYKIEEYWNSLLHKWDEKYKDVNPDEYKNDANYLFWMNIRDKAIARIFTLKSATPIQNCVNVAKTLLANYTLEFDANEDLFGCENGVIDIKAECFRPYQFDDFITFSCGYDFTPYVLGFKYYAEETFKEVLDTDLTPQVRDSFELLMDTYKQVFPDEELRDYFFKIISTGMSGRAIEKFFVFNGAGRNGKGMTNEFLEKVFGSYFTNVSPTIFNEKQNNKSSGSANPEIAKLDKKRYIVSKEPEKRAPLHNSVIKDLTGGGNTNARMLYSSKTNVKLCGTFVMECNVKPPFSEAPKDADISRINDILFGSHFSEDINECDETTSKENHIYYVNCELKQILKDSVLHRNTMLNILLGNLLMVKEAGYNVDSFKPESVKIRSLAYLQNSYDLHNIFTTHYEIRNEENQAQYNNWKGETEDADWTISKIASHIRKTQDFYDLPKEKKKEYTAKDVEDFFRTNKFYKSYVYMNTDRHAWVMRNWRLKPEEKEEE